METREPTAAEEGRASRFTELFAHSSTGMALVGPLPELRILAANYALAGLFQLEQVDLPGRPALDALADLAEDLRGLFEWVESRRQGAQASVPADGRASPLDLSVDPVLDRDGRLAGFLLLVRPAGARPEAAPADELKYRTLFEHSMDAVLFTAPDGRILDANPAATRMFGYAVDELRALGRRAIVEPSDPRLSRAVEERERTGRVFSRLTMKRKDGSRFEAEISSAVFGAGDQQRTSMLIRDVTEREKLLDELNEGRRVLSAVVDNAAVAIALLAGPDFRYVLVNPAYRALGEGRGFLGVPLAQAWPEVAEHFGPFLTRVLETGEPFHGEDVRVRLRRSPEGELEERFFTFDYVRLGPRADEGGSVLALVTETTGSVRARRRAEALTRAVMELNAGQGLSEVLRSVIERSRELLGGDDASIWLLDEDGLHLRGAMELLERGRTGAVIDLEQWPNNLRGIRERHAMFLTVPEALGSETWWFERMGIWGSLNLPLVVGERCLGMMYVNFRQEGYRPPPEDFEFALTLAAHCALAVDQARAYEQLEATKTELERAVAQLRAIFESMNEGLTIFDREGRLIEANDVARRMLGLELRGGALLEDYVPVLQMHDAQGRSLPREERPAHRVLRGESYERLEIFASVRGQDRAFSLNGKPVLDEHGEPALAVVTFRDVTEQKAIAAERERLLAEVQRRAAQLEDFVSIVSHDLRTPMTTVQANAHLARSQPDDREKVIKRAEAILTATRRMDRMISELVEVRRLESRKLVLDRTPVDVASFALELKERLADAVDASRIEVELPGEPTPVLADPDRLERILTNLLTNALKYSQGRIEMRFEPGPNEVTVSVTDHGPGLSKEDLGRIFERGFRARRTGMVEGLGLGLGLYITRMLVEAHGGRIWAESEPGEGATFRFTLPVA